MLISSNLPVNHYQVRYLQTVLMTRSCLRFSCMLCFMWAPGIVLLKISWDNSGGHCLGWGSSKFSLQQTCVGSYKRAGSWPPTHHHHHMRLPNMSLWPRMDSKTPRAFLEEWRRRCRPPPTPPTLKQCEGEVRSLTQVFEAFLQVFG